MLQTVCIKVKGIVQGVFYRQATRETAIQMDITGEIKNMPDGTVQIIATGNEGQLEDLIEWCKTGPKRAVVTDVIVEQITLRPFSSFKIVK
jgi:acylphosphatase